MIYIALYIVCPLISWFALVSLIPIVLINYDDDVKDLEVILVYYEDVDYPCLTLGWLFNDLFGRDYHW